MGEVWAKIGTRIIDKLTGPRDISGDQFAVYFADKKKIDKNPGRLGLWMTGAEHWHTTGSIWSSVPELISCEDVHRRLLTAHHYNTRSLLVMAGQGH